MKKLTHKGYSLTGNYSLVSMLGIVLVTVTLTWFYRENAIDDLSEVETAANVAIANVFANAVWEEYGEFVDSAGELPPGQLATHPVVDRLYQDVVEKMRGSRVVKIKIYDREGLTVFSTDKSQIGESKRDNRGFMSALAGQPVSDITYRNQFNAFDKVIEDRGLLFSYIPVYVDASGRVVAVFELYSDLTPLLDEIVATEYLMILVVSGLMVFLFLFLLFFVRRADRTIRQHEAQEREVQQERIRYLAEHDQLTGLPNRAMLMELLSHAIRRSQKTGKPLAVFLLDLDRFKLINDSLGQHLGDQLLMELVARATAVVGEQRVIGRVGGDEFVVLLEGVDPVAVEHLAGRLTQALSRPYRIQDREVTVTVSVGIALLSEAGRDAEHLVKHAEAALLQAKHLGRNRFAVFTADLDERAAQRYELESGLHRALENGEFEMYYQPRVDAVSGRALGAEALLRWNRSPADRAVGPAEFVPILEEMGLIVPVGAWILSTACRQCQVWREQGHENFVVSVNLSMRQFQSDSLLSDVLQALMDSGLPPTSLELELTESILADESEQSLHIMRALKDLGVELSIDDFGTGYSSLSYLMHYPVDYLKIDQAFVRDAVSNEDHANLTRTIVSMAESLKLATVAEGVETEAHRDLLVQLGCDQLQGYLFSRPLPAAEFQRYLQRQAEEQAHENAS